MRSSEYCNEICANLLTGSGGVFERVGAGRGIRTKGHEGETVAL